MVMFRIRARWMGGRIHIAQQQQQHKQAREHLSLRQNALLPRFRCWSSSTDSHVSNEPRHLSVSANHRSHLIFGANTEVGKTIVSAGLVRASLMRTGGRGRETAEPSTHYIKPLQTGGENIDQSFVERYCERLTTEDLDARTLFQWNHALSPHKASILENKPKSDQEVLSAIYHELARIQNNPEKPRTTTFIETAGGVLSPSAASPLNQEPRHAQSTVEENESSWGWIPQADLYQPLLGQAPVILVGDGRLGGIGATLSSLESLILRGFDVAAVVIIEPNDKGPAVLSSLREYASTRAFAMRAGSGEKLFSTPKLSMVGLPPLPTDPNEPLYDWYDSDQVNGTFHRLNQFLQASWEGQVQDLQSMRMDACKVIWWPFTQHGNIDTDPKNQVTVVDSASGDYWSVLMEEEHDSSSSSSSSHSKQALHRRNQFDACASWWTQGLGHGDSSLALASAAAAGRYGHVLFPQTVHAPALALSQKLLSSTGPGASWAKRVFFTDDGSTGMEVAIKMAMKLYQNRVGLVESASDYDWAICAQEGCYHGDTLGVMDVAEPSIFNEGQHPWYEPKGLFLKTPTLGYKDGKLSISFPPIFAPDDETAYEFDSVEQAMDVRARMLGSLVSKYKEIIELRWLVHEHSKICRIGACIIEPVLLGAGGMKFIDPLWQRALIEVAKSRSVPVVFDEVASGMYRVGVASCKDILQSNPDIACYAKLLTGGLLPLSVTLTTEEVFESFYGESKSQALLHGHSYTAHPVGCVAALQSLDAYDTLLGKHDRSAPFMSFDPEQVKELSTLSLVEQSFSLGTVLSVTIHPEENTGGYGASSRTIPIVARLRDHGIFARPLGNVIYIMVSPFTSKEECTRLTGILYKTIDESGKREL